MHQPGVLQRVPVPVWQPDRQAATVNGIASALLPEQELGELLLRRCIGPTQTRGACTIHPTLVRGPPDSNQHSSPSTNSTRPRRPTDAPSTAMESELGLRL